MRRSVRATSRDCHGSLEENLGIAGKTFPVGWPTHFDAIHKIHTTKPLKSCRKAHWLTSLSPPWPPVLASAPASRPFPASTPACRQSCRVPWTAEQGPWTPDAGVHPSCLPVHRGYTCFAMGSHTRVISLMTPMMMETAATAC